MAFSTGFGLTCMCFIMLLFLPGQGQCQCPKIKLPNVDSIPPECCTITSKVLVREDVKECYEQKEDFRPCRVHAYIFVTKSDNIYCVNPNASWLPARLEKLENRGITCKDLVK